MLEYLWRIDDGRIWSSVDNGFVNDVPVGKTVTPLYDSGRPAGIEYLMATIKFYGLAPEGCEWDAARGWVKHRFTRLAFFNLFTMTEKVAIKAAIAGGNLVAAVIYDSLTMAEFIDVADPATVEALHGLAGEPGGRLLTPERAAEILAGVIYETTA